MLYIALQELGRGPLEKQFEDSKALLPTILHEGLRRFLFEMR
jgi:hypothetical protein